MYKSLEETLAVCTEYVALDQNHLGVYSFRLSDIILRVGPEILRVFNLILFNPRRQESFDTLPNLENRIVSIQEKRESRKEPFMEYLDAVSLRVRCRLVEERVGLRALSRFIVPFEVEKRVRNGKEYSVISWWEDGYNALRHRVIDEFATSATLRNALFSLCALWVLHSILDFDVGRPNIATSEFFETPFTFRETKSTAEKLK